MNNISNSILNFLNISRSQAIKWLVLLVVLSAMFLIPITETITLEIKHYLIVTIIGILLVALDLVPILAVAFVIPAVYIVWGVCDAQLALSGFTNVNSFMAFGAFFFTLACIESGILNRISLWLIIKIGRGSYNRTLYAIVFAGTFLGFITVNAQQMVMIALAVGIATAMNRDKVDMATSMLMNAAQLSCITTRLAMYVPLQHALLSSGGITVNPDFAINWVDPLRFGWIWIPATFVLVWIYTKIFKTEQYSFGGGLEYLRDEYYNLGRMTTKEIKGLIYMTIIMFAVVTGSLTGISTANIFMTLPFLAFLPGINLANAKTFEKMAWGPLMLCPACIAFGNIGTALGLGELLKEMMMPLLQNSNPFTFFAAFYSITGALNFVMTPLALLSMLATPIAQMGAAMGIDPMASLLALYYSVECIFMPHESAGYLLLFSFGMMTMKDFIKLQTIKSVWILIVLLVLIVPYWMFIGLC